MSSLDSYLNAEQQRSPISKIIVPVIAMRRTKTCSDLLCKPNTSVQQAIAEVQASFTFVEQAVVSTIDIVSTSAQKTPKTPRHEAKKWAKKLIEHRQRDLRLKKTCSKRTRKFALEMFDIKNGSALNLIIEMVNNFDSTFWSDFLKREYWFLTNSDHTVKLLELLQKCYPLPSKSKVSSQYFNFRNKELAVFTLKCGVKPDEKELTPQGSAFYKAIQRVNSA
jgi:hypothetical protein